MEAMSIREAARWAQRRDALYINGDFDNPLYAISDATWKANNQVLCMGSYEKCQDFLQAKGAARLITGSYGTLSDGKHVRLCCLATVIDEMDESFAEQQVPERDYRHEDWAH